MESSNFQRIQVTDPATVVGFLYNRERVVVKAVHIHNLNSPLEDHVTLIEMTTPEFEAAAAKLLRAHGWAVLDPNDVDHLQDRIDGFDGRSPMNIQDMMESIGALHIKNR